MTYRYRQVIEEGGGLTYLRKRFRLTPSELLVLTNLIKHDHPRHGCFPKQETIALQTGLHKTQVWRAENGLEEKGLYTRMKKPYRDARDASGPGRSITMSLPRWSTERWSTRGKLSMRPGRLNATAACLRRR